MRSGSGRALPAGRRPYRAVALLAIAAAVIAAGCASLVPRPAPPELRAVRVDVLTVALPDLWLRLSLLMRNPNDAALAIDGLDVSVSLEGEAVSEARLARPVVLPADADARVDLEARADVSRALAVVGRSLGSGRMAIPYEVSGTVTLADGRRFPFTRRGTTGMPGGG
jgi:LEA14-like dessication related protein